jgi:transcriptional regulator with XRE-family HTH domain
MELVKRLIKIRGLSQKAIADQTGVGYHSINKAVCGATWTDASGKKHVRSNDEARAAVAAALCVPYVELWGPRAGLSIRKMIRREIDRKMRAERKPLESQYLEVA